MANKANGRITHPSQKIHFAQEKQPMYQRLKNDPDWEKFSIAAVALVQTTIRICTESDHDLSYPWEFNILQTIAQNIAGDNHGHQQKLHACRYLSPAIAEKINKLKSLIRS